MVNVFAKKSSRVPMYLLLHAKTLVSQMQIVEATGLSKGLVSRITSKLVANGLVKRPYRTRFSLEYPERLLVEWIGHRNISSKKAYFADDTRALKAVPHMHTLLSGAFLETGYLRTGFTTAYVKQGFKPKATGNLAEGRVGELKSKIILIPAEDEFVFYGQRKIKGQKVVNPFLLYLDLASLGGVAASALKPFIEKYGFPDLFGVTPNG